MSKSEIIGIAGPIASGKDSLSHFLVNEYGYRLLSGGDLLREMSLERHGSIERPYLHETAEHFRKTYGSDYIVKRLLTENSTGSNKLLISGVRAIGESDAIRKAGGMIVYVDAPQKLRYERMVSRLRDDESQISFAEFTEREKSEWHAGSEKGDFSLKSVKNNADIILHNESDLQGLQNAAVNALMLKRL